MSQGRRKHNPAFKAKVALQAVGGEETAAQLPPGIRSIPAGFRLGRRHSPRGAAGVFGNGQEQKAKSDAALIVRLHQEIGHMTSIYINPLQARLALLIYG